MCNRLRLRREGPQLTYHPEIDQKSAEKAPSCGLSANFVELLRGSELMKGGDKIPQSGDLISFSDQTFSPKLGGFDFLSKPLGEVKVDQISFLGPTTFKPSASCRLDGKPL